MASWKAYLEAHVLRMQIEPRRLVCVLGGLHGGEGWFELLIVAAQTRSPATLVRGTRELDPTSLAGPQCHALQWVSVVPPRTAVLHFGCAGDLRIAMGGEAIVHFRRGRWIEGERFVDLDDGRHFHVDDPSAGLDLLDEVADDQG